LFKIFILIVWRDFHVLSYIHKNLIKIELRELGTKSNLFLYSPVQ
jgi:hypothetical protein